MNSYFYKTYAGCLALDYKDGLLQIVEKWSNYPQFGDFVLPFLIGENFTWQDCGDEM